MRRAVKRLAAAVAFLAGLVIVLEAAFRLAGLWVARAPEPAREGSVVVLCVGDSHTRGRRDPENYPFQLERILNERTGRPYRVINLGIPGQNTAQVRNRFERYLVYYRPSVVLHFGGVNNGWNRVETSVWHPSLLARIGARSRILRFIRVAVFYRRLAHATVEQPDFKLRQWPDLNRAVYHVNFGGVEEDIRTEAGTGEKLSAAEVEAVTHDDLAAMMRMAQERGIPMYLVMYPIRDLVFEPVNRAVERVSGEFQVPYVDSPAAARALADRPTDELYDTWAHPTPILYRHIAEEAYGVLVKQGIVRPASEAPGGR